MRDPLSIESTVSFFRPRRQGPELAIENHVLGQLQNLFSFGDQLRWTAGSVPIGAGMPDLVLATYDPRVVALANAEITDTQILGYLRAVTRARIDTIAERMRIADKFVTRSIHRLVEASIVRVEDDTASLLPGRRDLLQEIITIEVKVSNWQRAIDQARRNQLFSHRAFVALPREVAQRVRTEPAFVGYGIGLLSVDESGDVTLMRRSRRSNPSVWTYYYHLASLVARSQK